MEGEVSMLGEITGTLIFLFICLWIVSLVGGMLLAHYTWTPPGQLKRGK